MNPPNHPTPRTDAAWAASFSPERATFSVRDECEKLERELAAAKAECERLKVLSSWAHTCVHHTDKQRSDAEHCPVCATAELTRLRAELERFTGHGLLDCHAICDQRDAAVAERDRLRAQLAAIEEDGTEEHNAAVIMRQKLVALLDRAEKAEAECLEQARLLGMSGEREADLLGKLERLAKDKARLDWLAVSDTWFDYPATESFNPETFRDAIDAAMKGTP